MAARGKTSVGWFYGFKLYVVVNDQGDLLADALTPGNVHDTRPVAHLLRQTTRLFGLLIGDKGYISQPLADQLAQQYDVRLLTRRRSNMRPVDLEPVERLLLRKRAIIETIFDQLTQAPPAPTLVVDLGLARVPTLAVASVAHVRELRTASLPLPHLTPAQAQQVVVTRLVGRSCATASQAQTTTPYQEYDVKCDIAQLVTVGRK